MKKIITVLLILLCGCLIFSQDNSEFEGENLDTASDEALIVIDDEAIDSEEQVNEIDNEEIEDVEVDLSDEQPEDEEIEVVVTDLSDEQPDDKNDNGKSMAVDEIEKQQKNVLDEREGFLFKSSKMDRTFELGYNANLGFANNYFHLDDIFVETVKVDFTEMTQELKNGLQFNTFDNAVFFVGVKTPKFYLDLELGIDGDCYFNLSNDLLALLGTGIEAKDSLEVKLSAGGSFYADINVNTGLALKTPFGPIKVEISPSYFLPLFFTENTSCGVKATFNEDGTINLLSENELTMYSVLNLENSSIDFSKGGFDVDLGFGYQLFPFLDLGVTFACIPILGSDVNSVLNYKVSIDKTIPSIMGMIEGEPIGEMNLVTEEVEEVSSITVNRPFKLVLDANWRVFNIDLLQIIPVITFEFNNVSAQSKFDIDYQASALVDLRFFKAAYTTARCNDVFYQELSAILNVKCFQLDLAVAMQSPNFLKSFTGAGLGAKLGMTFGF